MLGLKTFIFSLCIWLSFSSPIDFNGVNLTIESQAEITISTFDSNHQALLVENHLEIGQANWSLKTFNLVYDYLSENFKHLQSDSYDYKLLYLEIGDTISLTLTPRVIIFPFHTFT